MKLFILLGVMLFATSGTYAQTKVLKNHKADSHVQRRPGKDHQQRVQMQLRQAQYHGRQVKRAEKVQREVSKEQQKIQ